MMKREIILSSCCTFVMFVTICSGGVSRVRNFEEDNINKYIFDGRNFKFIDLTLSLNKQYSQLSEGEKARVRLVEEYNAKDMYNGAEFCEKDWIGTTLDLNYKYDPLSLDVQAGGNHAYFAQRVIKSLTLESLILPLIIVDISSKVNGDINFMLKKYHVDFFLNNYFGNTAQPCIIVFKFGWSALLYDIRRYYGLIEGKNETSGTPGLSVEVAKWITTDYKNIVGVGVDLPSVDAGNSNVAHNTLVNAGLYVVTNVGLEQYLPDAWCTAVLLPLADQGARAPVRFIAICPKSRMERHEIPLHRL